MQDTNTSFTTSCCKVRCMLDNIACGNFTCGVTQPREDQAVIKAKVVLETAFGSLRVSWRVFLGVYGWPAECFWKSSVDLEIDLGNLWATWRMPLGVSRWAGECFWNSLGTRRLLFGVSGWPEKCFAKSLGDPEIAFGHIQVTQKLLDLCPKILRRSAKIFKAFGLNFSSVPPKKNSPFAKN